MQRLLLTTDGYIDQNGGEKGFPLGKRRLKELLTTYRDRPIDEFCEGLRNAVIDWQGEQERNDDLTLVGIDLHRPD